METQENDITPIVSQQRLVRLLELLDKETREDTNGYADRALWHALKRWEDNLPELGGDFHKTFRQCDVTDSGHTDMVIWCLLNHSERFWRLFEMVHKEKPGAMDNEPLINNTSPEKGKTFIRENTITVKVKCTIDEDGDEILCGDSIEMLNRVGALIKELNKALEPPQKHRVTINNTPDDPWKLYDGEEFVGYICSFPALDDVRAQIARNGYENFTVRSLNNTTIIKISKNGKLDHWPPSLFPTEARWENDIDELVDYLYGDGKDGACH